MSLYSKKLHIKKPNNQIQIANLYTDKNDVGSNYLTLNDNNNIVYVPLMNNGDIDCKVKKNNQIFKVNSFANIRQNGSVPINFIKRGAHDNITEYYPQTFTVPDNVHVVNLYFKSIPVSSIGSNGHNRSINVYIKVTPNKTYTCQYSTIQTITGDKYYHYDVTIQFASLVFKTYYLHNTGLGSIWHNYIDGFALNWYANEPNYQYSAD